jgi:hypothetical protein
MNKHLIASLRAERETYLVRGWMDRVVEVDKVLAAYGVKPDAPVVETAALDTDVEQAKVVRGRKRKKA